MYSDDEESPEESSKAGSLLESAKQASITDWPTWPYLKLYEQEEADRASTLAFAEFRATKEGQKPQKDGYDGRGVYRVLRFFRSIEGFHKGSLDLTGRHRFRYEPLRARWDRYIEDFNLVREHTREQVHEVNYGNESFPVTLTETECIVTPPDVLDDFMAKWRQPLSYDILYIHTVRVLKTLSQFPTPKYQQTVLLDLPSELLDHIMLFASQSKARLLGATCRRLREISLRYIYENRTLTLKFQPDVNSIGLDGRERSEYLKSLVEEMKTRFLDTVDSLLARPDIMRRTMNLSIVDDWQSVSQGSYAFEVDITTVSSETGIEPDADYYKPVMTRVAAFIRASVNLTKITLSCVFVTPAMLHAITSLPQLHTVVFSHCRFSPGLRKLAPRQLCTSSSILNLRIFGVVFPWRYWDTWYFLSICPQVRTVAIRGSMQTELEIPSIEFRLKYNFFSTVERFSIDYLGRDEVTNLSAWILEGKAGSPTGLHLTHFKLDTLWAIGRTEAFQLIDALAGAPLHTLHLAGLRYVEYDLIEHIAQALPDLIALTLVHRWDHNPKRTDRLYVWPHMSWEYAPFFGNFRRLEHLGLNCAPPGYSKYLNGPEWIERLESETLTPESIREENVVDRDRDEELCWYEDDWTIARVYAIHCRALKTFTLQDSAVLPTFLISRKEDDDGTPIVREEAEPGYMVGVRKYSPNGVTNVSWDPIIPIGQPLTLPQLVQEMEFGV